MALPAGGTLRFVGQRRTALPGTPGPCAEFQNGLRKFFDAHRAPAAPRACDASEPSWVASEGHLRCTRKSTYENQRRCVRVVKSAASDAGDLGSSPGEVTFCDKLACARLRRVLVALPLETSRPPSSRTAKHRMPHPGKPRRHGRGPARSLGRSPMHPRREWEEAQKSCCPTQCDTTHTERPQCVGSDVGRKALGNGRNASSQIPCASAHSEKCQILLGRIRGRPGALPRDLARDAGPWERAQGAACGDSLSPVPLSAGGALRGPARRSTKAPSASKHRPRAPNFEILCSRAMTPTDWNRNGIARSSELNAFPARCIALSP